MSTTSEYSSNKLNQVISNKTQHFVTKSFITASFETDKSFPEYHLYWVNLKKKLFEEDSNYTQMSFKLMNKKEVSYFKSIINDYELKQNNNYGSVWENKKLGFNKNLVLVKQMKLF